ncbi:hypothetical protein DPMN_185892 [Dreissena polymorpha]|uniref:Uncharacterized protein n=1 Tax=Dreissena polymorpha TaxID=45954 RepID=A0A9D4DPG9_DREPO|nr:hypothetical protein DPMN_185892 [Dreissena polymorpha]
MGIDIGLYRIRIGLFSMPFKTGFKLRVLCVKRQCVWLVLRLAIALSLLTLLGGDVEKNPGPVTKNTRQQTLSFSQVPASETPPRRRRRHHQRTSRTRSNNTDNDSEVMNFLREMKLELKNDLSSINSKINDISNTVNMLKNENEQLRQEHMSMKQELSNVSSKLDRLEVIHGRKQFTFSRV